MYAIYIKNPYTSKYHQNKTWQTQLKCCAAGGSSGGGGSGSCNLVTYSNTHIKGYNGLRVRVDAVILTLYFLFQE